ncbi:DUF4136 domain-containing protein [Psychromonas sp. KJ10-2]|uniref:DUF4136 domain-containing protein n=1 Tax=Psychromonas sp. KJ10-2 TaxID=3391822 RepID=UPI0039B49E74
MKKIKITALLTLIMLISACSSYSVDTTRTTFYQDQLTTTGSIYIATAEGLPNNSLELASYKQKIANKLNTVGYRVISDITQADYIATIDYGINEGNTYIVTIPDTRPRSRLIHRGKFARIQHRDRHKKINSPTSNIVTTYNRVLALDITSAQDNSKVYESQVTSIGECEIMAGVFEQLLEAMFTDFPGENGKIRKASIPYQGECNE